MLHTWKSKLISIYPTSHNYLSLTSIQNRQITEHFTKRYHCSVSKGSILLILSSVHTDIQSMLKLQQCSQTSMVFTLFSVQAGDWDIFEQPYSLKSCCQITVLKLFHSTVHIIIREKCSYEHLPSHSWFHYTSAMEDRTTSSNCFHWESIFNSFFFIYKVRL